IVNITYADGQGTRLFGYDGDDNLTSDSWSPLLATFTYDSPGSPLDDDDILKDVNRGLGSDYQINALMEQPVPARQGYPAPEALLFGQQAATVVDGLTHRSTYTLDERGRQ